MAKGPSYRLPFRRRREGKTDYKARKALIISKLPRVVTRVSLRHMNVQIIEATPTGDRVIASAKSQELRNYDWKTPCGNLPSAYLTGLLCGVRASGKKVKEAVPDIGLTQPTKGARIFASVKGVVDAGVKVPHSTEKLPSEERLKGQHIANYAEALSSDAELYERVFSRYLKAKVPPEKIPKQFEDSKEKILSSPKRQKKTEKKGKVRKVKRGIKKKRKSRRKVDKK